MAKRNYRTNWLVQHDGVDYAKDSVIELESDQAAPLIVAKAVSLVDSDEAARLTAVSEAVAKEAAEKKAARLIELDGLIEQNLDATEKAEALFAQAESAEEKAPHEQTLATLRAALGTLHAEQTALREQEG